MNRRAFSYQYHTIFCLCLSVILLLTYWQVKDFTALTNEEFYLINMLNGNQLTISDTSSFMETLQTISEMNFPYALHIPILSMLVEKKIMGSGFSGYRLTHLVFHIVASLFLFFLLLHATQAFWNSAFTTCLFAFHSINTESIATLYGRVTILGGLLGVITLFMYVVYAKSPTIKKYLFFLTSLLLALITKPSTLGIIFMLPLLDYWPLKRLFSGNSDLNDIRQNGSPAFPELLHRQPFNKIAILDKIPILILCATVGAFTYFYFKNTSFVNMFQGPHSGSPLWSILMYTPISVNAYIWKILYPIGLPAYTSPLFIKGPSIWWVICSTLLILFLSLTAIRTARTHPYFIVGWLWFLGGLTPHIVLIFSYQRLVVERYAYIPAIGLFLIISWGGSRLLRRLHLQKNTVAAIAIILLAASIVITWHQTKHWQTPFSYYQHALSRFPDDFKAHANLGKSLMIKGRDKQAIKHFNAALRINPQSAVVHSYLGNIYTADDKLKKAQFHFKQALQLDPTLATAHGNYANLLMKLDKTDQAIFHYKTALSLDKMQYTTHNNLATALIQKGEFDQAYTHLKEALAIKPDYQTALQNLKQLRAFRRH